jgi:drug/metabolite transporter (DMT)-like permease
LASNWAHRFVGVTVSSVIVAANPVVAAGAAAIFLRQSLGLVQIIGGLAAIMAVAAVAGRAVRVEAVEAVAA